MKRCLSPSALAAVVLATTGGANGFGSLLQDLQAPAQSVARTAPEKLTIKIVAGEDSVNIVKRRSAVTPVVEVLNQNNLPVAGAMVNFSSPDDGASVKFSNGNRSESAVTEMDGKASPSAVIPTEPGKFQIAVTATYGDGLRASATIDQTNYETAADAARGGSAAPGQPVKAAALPVASQKGGGRLSNGAIAGIIVAIAGGAALGIALGLKHGGSSTSSSTIGVGTPTVGAPH